MELARLLGGADARPAKALAPHAKGGRPMRRRCPRPRGLGEDRATPLAPPAAFDVPRLTAAE